MNPRVSVLKRAGRPFFELQYRDPVSGKKRRKSARTTKQREAQRAAVEWERALAHQIETPPPPTNRFTVSQLIHVYLEHCEGYYVKNGRVTDEVGCVRSAVAHAETVAGDLFVDEFGPKRLRAVIDSMIAAGNSRTYINRQVKRVRLMFGWGVAEEIVPEGTARALHYVKGLAKGKTNARETPPVEPVVDAIVEATLDELDEQLKAMIQLQRLTGMRPGEVRMMRPADVDRSHRIWLYQPRSHKTERFDINRVVAIGPKAQLVLTPYLLRGPDDFCFQPIKSHRDWYTKDAYALRIRKAAKRAKVEHWHPNQLRHSAASEIRREFDLDSARAVLGHTEAATTEIYAQADVKKAMAIAERYG